MAPSDHRTGYWLRNQPTGYLQAGKLFPRFFFHWWLSFMELFSSFSISGLKQIKCFISHLLKTFRLFPGNTVDSNKLVIGIDIHGESRAYPIQIIGYHHQVKDTVGNTPVMITYCTVCRTGRVYSPVRRWKTGKIQTGGHGSF